MPQGVEPRTARQEGPRQGRGYDAPAHSIRPNTDRSEVLAATARICSRAQGHHIQEMVLSQKQEVCSTLLCVQIASRVDGAELLQAAEAAGQGSEEDDFHISSSGSSDEDASGSGQCSKHLPSAGREWMAGCVGSGSEDEAAGSSDGDEDGSEWVDVSSEDSGGVGQEGGEEGRSPGKGADGQKSGGKAGGKRRRAGSLGVESSEGNEGESGSESDLSESDDEGDEEEGSSGSSSGEGEEDSDDDGSDKPSSSKKLQQQPDR
eukprot:1160464-Pelagomonas_calceolata.AAC.1